MRLEYQLPQEAGLVAEPGGKGQGSQEGWEVQ